MDEREIWRFSNLKEAEVDPEFLQELHGLPWPFENELKADFDQMMTGLPNPPQPNATKAPRFHIERFMALQDLDSLRFSAANLGMTQDSLTALLPHLKKLGLRTEYQPYPNIGLIGRSLSEDLTRKLPGLRFKTFGTHDAFCELLHGSLKEELDFTVEPLYCATQEIMAPLENGYRMFASTWDNLTMEPLSARHQVWLDLGKPLSLTPDRCSKYFYALHRDQLSGCLAGRGEPRDLDTYMRLLETFKNV